MNIRELTHELSKVHHMELDAWERVRRVIDTESEENVRGGDLRALLSEIVQWHDGIVKDLENWVDDEKQVDDVYEKGQEEGYDEGYDKGHDEGYGEGYYKGREEGYARGYKERGEQNPSGI